MRAVVAGYERHLGLERGLSAHTVRAYVGDAVALLGFVVDGGGEVADLDLARLRAWLAAQQAGGASRTTLARRAA
ncbi:integrase/recombinase XerC, partial [Amycolatopsis vancoresmycina DSM 44592]